MNTEQSIYWKRIGRVAIEGRNGEMIDLVDSSNGNVLDFKFSGEITCEIYTAFTVSVLGLTMDSINALTVWNPDEAFNRKRRIQVFAGYEKDGIANPLFDGFIVEAMPTNPPEMWLNFKCLRNFDLNDPVKLPIVVVGTMKDIFEKVAKELGMNYRIVSQSIYDSVRFENVVKFSMSGSRGDLAQKFADEFGVSVYNDGDTLIMDSRRPWCENPKNAREVSTETGMLGLGNISMRGAVIRRRLDDTVKCMSWINLKSQIVPSANGNYFVIRKKHVGHFRRDDWYTELECIREQKGK